jgi:hypothetical protein
MERRIAPWAGIVTAIMQRLLRWTVETWPRPTSKTMAAVPGGGAVCKRDTSTSVVLRHGR